MMAVLLTFTFCSTILFHIAGKGVKKESKIQEKRCEKEKK